MRERVFISATSGLRCGEQVSHPHVCEELYVSLGGRTTDIVNGQENKTLPLDVFVLSRDSVHGQINSTEYRYCIFKFDLPALISGLGELSLGADFQSLFIVDPALRERGEGGANMQIDPLTAEYAELLSRLLEEEGESELADELFTSFALLLASRAHRRESAGGAKSAVSEAVLYLNTHYAEEITFEALATVSGYSSRHLSRAFSELMGTSPMRYLADVRLSRAASLIAEGRLSVTEVAAAVGIADSSAFTKSFRRRFGMTPSEYRRSIVEN